MQVSKLVDEIVSEWKIPCYKVFCILTDNGSNMIAAFKGDIHLQNDQEFEADLAIEVNSDSSDTEDEVVEEDNFEEEAAVEDGIPEEPCVEELWKIMMIMKPNVILH